MLEKQNLANRDATETSQHTRPRLPAYNNKRVQSVTRAVNHLTLQNRTFFEHQPTLEGKPSTK